MICRECAPHVESSSEGHPRSITHAQRQACVKAIIVVGLENVVDMRNILSEHLNVVVSTNIVSYALQEVGLGSLQKQKESWPKMCIAGWDLLNIIKIGLSMIGIGWSLLMRLRSIDFILMVNLGIVWEMVQFLCGVVWLLVARVTCAR